MSETWSITGICRCCHTQGTFRSLDIPLYEDRDENIMFILQNTFNITIHPVLENFKNLNTICDTCIPRLLDAEIFKQQVLSCEKKFFEYYNRCLLLSETKKEISDENVIKNNESDDDKPYFDVFTDLDDEPLAYLKSQESKPDADWTTPVQSDEKEKKPGKKKNYSCNYCEKKFAYHGSLEMHIQTHKSQKTHICILCKETFKQNKDLINHINAEHVNEGRFVCSLCDIVFDTARLLRKHFTSHTDKFVCNSCGKDFARKKGLKEHMKVHTGEKRYKCDVCNKCFGHNQTLKSHILTHTGERPYVCDVCGRRFPQRTHLKRHIHITHNGFKPHACKHCHKQFSSKSYLRIHERQHTGEKPYSCDVCKKDFRAHTTLKVHMRTHTGVKPYLCTFCDRKFSQMASFKLHERTHTGERPFVCDICKKTFSDNGYLKIHMRIHTGDKPFACDVCNRQFREVGQMKRHMRMHSGVKAYTCKICNKQIGNLSKHMRVHDERINIGSCDKGLAVDSDSRLYLRAQRPSCFDVCDRNGSNMSELKRTKCIRSE